jgi:hypothetical protein
MKIILTLALLLFIGCNGTPSASTPVIKSTDIVINGFNVPPAPDPIENDKTFFGVDSDNNGVRDDIDREIARKSKNRVDKEMATSYVKNFTEAISEPEKAFSEKTTRNLCPLGRR